jgi:hypothetical protein
MLAAAGFVEGRVVEGEPGFAALARRLGLQA